MTKMTKIENRGGIGGAGFPLRVTHRVGGKKQSPSIRVKCGCCNEAVEIYFDKETSGSPYSDALEINGVNGTVDQWRQVLLPLLKVPTPAL